MAISAISNAAAATTTVAMSTHATGDLILASVRRNGSTTAPTIPAGWTVVKTQTGTTSWHGVYKKIAASSSETTGTWTSASAVEVNVYRGASDAVAANATGGTGTGTTITYPAITLQKTDSTSWVFRTAGATAATNITTNTPTGYTARGGVATPTGSAIRGCDSNAGLASSPGTGTQTVSGSGVWIAISVELKVPNASISTISDAFNTGSTPNAAIWKTLGGTETLSSGQLLVPASVGDVETTPVAYDFTGNGMYVQVVAAVADAVFFVADTSIGYTGGWYMNSSSQVEVYHNNAATGTTRTHTNGDWYRFREAGGTIFWDYSSNGTSWTNLFSTTSPGATNFFVQMYNLGASGTARFDNFNTPPAATNTGAFFVMF